MSMYSQEVFDLEDYSLEVLDMKNDMVDKYALIEKGYLFHFYLGENSITKAKETNTKFSLDYNWKISLPGNLDNLKTRLDRFKHNLINDRAQLVNDLDQFGFLFLFVVKSENMYELIISSDDFSFDTISSIMNK